MLLQSKGVQAKAYDMVIKRACQGIANPGTIQGRQTCIFNNVNNVSTKIILYSSYSYRYLNITF